MLRVLWVVRLAAKAGINPAKLASEVAAYNAIADTVAALNKSSVPDEAYRGVDPLDLEDANTKKLTAIFSIFVVLDRCGTQLTLRVFQHGLKGRSTGVCKFDRSGGTRWACNLITPE